jgi:hypothetical protein
MSFENKEQKLPILKGKIKTDSTLWKDAKILIDSGAEVSIVSRKYLMDNGIEANIYKTEKVKINTISSSICYDEAVNIIIKGNNEYDVILVKAYIATNNTEDIDIILETGAATKIIQNTQPNISIINQTTPWGRIWNIDSNEMPDKYMVAINKIQKQLNNDYCEQYFKETTKLRNDKRLEVRYPIKEGMREALGDSLTKAKVRLYSLEKTLAKDEKLKIKYCDFIKNLLNQGHIIRLPGSLQHWINPPAKFLPHHQVFKKSDGLNGKLRVVFDAALKTSNGLSLNDI